jgi:hypothetical protein
LPGWPVIAGQPDFFRGWTPTPAGGADVSDPRFICRCNEIPTPSGTISEKIHEIKNQMQHI